MIFFEKLTENIIYIFSNTHITHLSCLYKKDFYDNLFISDLMILNLSVFNSALQ